MMAMMITSLATAANEATFLTHDNFEFWSSIYTLGCDEYYPGKFFLSGARPVDDYKAEKKTTTTWPAADKYYPQTLCWAGDMDAAFNDGKALMTGCTGGWPYASSPANCNTTRDNINQNDQYNNGPVIQCRPGPASPPGSTYGGSDNLYYSSAEDCNIGTAKLAIILSGCDVNPCKNGGTCETASSTCNCKPGFTGFTCGYIDACDGQDCGNGSCKAKNDVEDFTFAKDNDDDDQIIKSAEIRGAIGAFKTESEFEAYFY